MVISSQLKHIACFFRNIHSPYLNNSAAPSPRSRESVAYLTYLSLARG